uniref:OSJNBa0070O11.9 protein n=1 Tax=Oryza sativa subsp. japonica TaxID=39947 RepID=Q7XQE1_ORYSJ|nr:OSJNBa0070O11.9 [Oryza sativa Japonica Group]
MRAPLVSGTRGEGGVLAGGAHRAVAQGGRGAAGGSARLQAGRPVMARAAARAPGCQRRQPATGGGGGRRKDGGGSRSGGASDPSGGATRRAARQREREEERGRPILTEGLGRREGGATANGNDERREDDGDGLREDLEKRLGGVREREVVHGARHNRSKAAAMVEAHRSARRCELRRWNWTGEQRTRWTSGWRTRRCRWRGAAATLAAARGGRSGGDGGGGWAHGARAIGSSGADGKRGKKVERGAVVGYIEVGRPDVAGSGGSAATTWRGGGGERGGEYSNRIPPSRARARAVRCGERAATWACGTGGVGAGNGETGGVGGGFGGGGAVGWRRKKGPTGKGGGTLRLDDGDGAPVVDSDGEGADEDGDATATTMATSPSDGDDWSDSGARLERRRRRRREVSRG